jgi:3-hydroxyisobutyrate dehydrogenase-like beta-hydroxyacid dehydrogenase
VAGAGYTGFVDSTLAADAGQAAASTASSLVANADAVLFLLPDSSVAERVVFGEGGVLGACREGRVAEAGGAPASAVSPS